MVCCGSIPCQKFSISPPFFLSSSSQVDLHFCQHECIWFWGSTFQKSAVGPAHFRAQVARQLVAVREERFQELVTAEVAYLATVPVKPVSMSQAGCSTLQSIFKRLKFTKLGELEGRMGLTSREIALLWQNFTCLTTSIQVRLFLKLLHLCLFALKIVTWRNAGDMVPIIQKEVPKRFALRIRLIETLDGWQDR